MNLRLLFTLLMAGISLVAGAQTGSVQGKVTDSKGEPLPGATVVVKGTTIGTISDPSGVYKFSSLPAGNTTLVVTYVGYASQEIAIEVQADKSVTSDFILSEEYTKLDELVVIGYGTKRKRDITSSISSVKSDEIANIPALNFQSRLQGMASGVQITNSNGMPGGAVTVRIRGTTSINGSSEPLYVVDGIPMITGSYSSGWADQTNALSSINPNDIESIEVLKDASAAAIYGTRAANGVILITTKKGKAGVTKFTVNYYAGISQVTHKPNLLNGPQYLKYAKIAWANSGKDTSNNYDAFYKNLPFGITRGLADSTNTDWIDVMTRTAHKQNIDVSASGGDAKTTFYLNGSYNQEQGIAIGNDYSRLSGRVNVEHNATEKFKLGVKANFIYELNKRVPSSWAGGLGTAQSRSLPFMPVYNTDGTLFAPTSGTNPLAYQKGLEYAMNVYTLIGNAFAEYHFTPWLYFRSEEGLTLYNQKESHYESTLAQSSGKAYSDDRRVLVTNWTANNTLNFNKSFGAHTVTAMIGMTAQANNYSMNDFNGTDFPNPALKNPGNGAIKNGGADESNWAFISYLSRASYNYGGKYYVEASVRRDGSSRFGPNKQYGTFPAFSTGWVLTEESFLKNLPILSFLKLRAGYGIQGNAELPGDFLYLTLWGSALYNGLPGLRISQIGNDNLGWESTAQQDYGLDFQLWKGRVSGGFDYYIKNTYNLLMPQPVPQTSGGSSVQKNVGKMNNQGIELFLTTNNLSPVSPFKWSTNFNFATNKNKVLDIKGIVIHGENYGNNVAVEGLPIGIWDLVKWAGIQQDDATLTLHDWADANDHSKGTITKTINVKGGSELFYNYWGEKTNEFNFDRDHQYVGNPYPKYTGGIMNNFAFKGIDLSILFTFSYGNNIYRDDAKFLMGGFDGNWNQETSIMNAWTPTNKNTNVQKLYWQPDNRNYNSTRYLEDGSYLRLKSLTIGYSLPTSWLQKVKFERVRIYFTAYNLWTLTNYSGWDPEVNRDGSGNRTQGVTYLSPPQVKTMNIGIELGF